MNRIAVIGAGIMGGGIAQLFAEHERQVWLWDADAAALQQGFQALRARLAKRVDRQELTLAEAEAITKRIHLAASPEDLCAADLVIEAIVEDIDAKRLLLAEISKLVGERTVIGSNTSSLRIADLARACRRPERFLGIHFFNPPTKLALIELAATPLTDPAVIESVRACLESMGKSPVTVADAPGFIVNRLLLLQVNEAARMLDEGVAAAADIDAAMQLGALHPLGPLALADLIGLDTCERILDSLHRALGRIAYAPATGIRARVAAGKLGRKSKEGFFNYQG